MGEVYRAHDPRTGRDVAIKISAERFSERFDREVRSVAALNHPNICTLFDVGPNYLVMELVEGDAPQGPMPLDEALKVIRQIAAALDEAHEKGIVHRDLKPANIKIKPDGTVKVLDFGLAKVGGGPMAQSENSPTLSMAATQMGVVLGTAGYMSPEQTRGKTVDKRADIWAFGVVLYEILTGRRLFQGEDITETLASVVKEIPDLSAVPARVRPLLQRCLEKDPKKRLRDIGDAMTLLEEAPAGKVDASSRRWLWPGVAAAVAAVALWGWLRPAPPVSKPVTRFRIQLPGTPALNPVALSRDGSRMAFSMGPGKPIYVRRLDQLDATPLAGTEGGALPCFSPDGDWIAYYVGAAPFQLKKVPVAGGTPLTLLDSVPVSTPLSWGPDDRILFSSFQTIQRIPAGGGKPQTLVTADRNKGQLGLYGPQLLPDGKQVLYAVITPRGLNEPQAAVLNLRTGESKILPDSTVGGRYVDAGDGSGAGYLIYGRESSLFAVPFSLKSLQAGSPAPVLEGVMGVSGLVSFGLSESGTLTYVAGVAPANPIGGLSTLSWVDRQGREQPLPAPPRIYGNPHISPDGQRVAIDILSMQPLTADVWVYDLSRNGLNRMTFERFNGNSVWTPDGKQMVYVSSPDISATQQVELRSVSADSSGAPATLAASSGMFYIPTSVSPDGKLVAGFSSSTYGPGTVGGGLWLMPLPDRGSPPAKPQQFLESKFLKSSPQFSPDGKWLAYASNETGRNEVYVVPYPGLGGKQPVSNDGGAEPRWARSGRELFYRNGGKLMAVDVETGAGFRPGTPHMLFDKPGAYDVSPDGSRFFLIRQTEAAQGPADVRVVVNWVEELRRRVPPVK